MREVYPSKDKIRSDLGGAVLVELYEGKLELVAVAEAHCILVALELKGALHNQGDQIEDGDNWSMKFIEESCPHEDLLQTMCT
jgi:hypothetical protein